MGKPDTPRADWQWVEYEVSTTQRGMTVAHADKPLLVDHRGRELRRVVGFVARDTSSKKGAP